ncbi:phnG protein [Klebsiella variicola]|uniref:PhnG protein n=1 Tax=Klebsiella variicola TaxID=244366 RepID=A0A7H4MBL8_KLEVA|nr:phnG protein [Klebsiella variicola]
MSVLAHSEPQDLLARMQSLQLAPAYELIRTPETGLVQLQARMGGIGDRFFAGDATLTRRGGTSGRRDARLQLDL